MRLARACLTDGRIVLARVEGEEIVVVATESAHPAADVVREAIAAGLDLTASGDRFALMDLEVLRRLPTRRRSFVLV
jgi:GGDEF domain-containing protein